MARLLFVAIFAICLVCMLQASPVPDQAQQPDLAANVEKLAQQTVETVKQVFTAAGETISEASKDPDLQKLTEAGKRLGEKVITAIHDQLQSLAPKA